MSHELRTPLNAVLGFAQLLEREAGALNTTQLDKVKQILYAGRHLLELVNDVLDLSRIESGEFGLSIEGLDIRDTAASILTATRTMAAQRGIRVIDRTEGHSLPTVLGDATGFKEILQNFLSNAVKYNEDAGAVTFDCTQSADDLREGFVRLLVSDTGLGIGEEMQEKLFEPFNRLGMKNTEIEGTGIGLAIAKELIEAMGGYLGYESELGKGSTFWFDLPIAMETSLTGPDGELDTVQSRSTASGAERNPDTREKHTVLYIEDNPANLLLMEDVAIGFDSIDLISAASAETGLVMAKEVRPTLLLMDINLPGMDGFTALKELQKSSETEDIPVIAVSANAMPDDLQRAKDAGFKGYVKKPFQIDALIGEIDSHLPK